MSSNELWDVYGFGVTLGCLYLAMILEKQIPLAEGNAEIKSALAFHFSATQRVPAATGQNGGAQPPPHACHKDVMRVRARARQAEL